MRKVLVSIPVLVFLTLLIWVAGAWGAIEFNNDGIVVYAKVAAGVPILFLFVRKSIRLGWREDFEPTYTLDDAKVHWTPDNPNAFDKAFKFIDQLNDNKAKRVGVVLSVIGAMYYFSAPFLVASFVNP